MLRRSLLAGSLCMLLVPLFAIMPYASAQSSAPTPLPGFPRTEIREVNFTSPTVVDLDGDGTLEVLTGDMGGCVWAFSPSGTPKAGFPWTTQSGCNTINSRFGSALAVGDVDGDGKLEVAGGTRGTGTSAGSLGKTYVWNHDGTLAAGWPKEMTWNPRGNGGAEVTGVSLANVAGDGTLEVIAGTSNNSLDTSETTLSMYVYRGDGSTLPGWPVGFRAAGIYGSVGAADLDGDGYANPITGRDQLYFHAYRADGTWLPGWPLRAYVDANKTNYYADPYVEFTDHIPAMGDLDGDGTIEAIIAGKRRQAPEHVTIDCGVFVVEPNGSRRPGWEQPKSCGASWLSSQFRPQNGVALGDLDGNGTLEIVVTLFDGTVRAYSAGGQQLWSYNYAQGKTLFASEPVIGDVTGDGKLDILFGTYSPDGSADSSAGLLGLDAQGRPLSGYPLTLPGEGNAPKRGLRAAPTLADLDGNGTVEIVAASLGGTLYAWTTGVSYNTELMPWPTGRQNNQRTGWFQRTSTGPGATATRTPTPGATATRTATPGATATRTATPGATATRTATPTTAQYSLRYSTSSSRSGTLSLSAARVSGNIYVFLAPEANLKQVRFWVDNPSRGGTPLTAESYAPFDLKGGTTSTANAFDTRTLSNGSHTVSYEATQLNGAVIVGVATFTVAN